MSIRPFVETAPTGSLEFNLRFAGQYYDKETGTHYNINRDYNPVIGRYIQSDPIGLDGGLSTFAYVNGNPVMRIDVNGLVDMSFITTSSPNSNSNFLEDAWTFASNASIILAGKNFNPSGYFTVLAHGLQGMLFYADSKSFSASGLDEIAKRAKVSGKPKIMLIVCHAGTGKKYFTWGRETVSTPTYLARKSGMDVIASDQYIDFGTLHPVPAPQNGKSWLVWSADD